MAVKDNYKCRWEFATGISCDVKGSNVNHLLEPRRLTYIMCIHKIDVNMFLIKNRSMR